jgi:hypothetical protein
MKPLSLRLARCHRKYILDIQCETEVGHRLKVALVRPLGWRGEVARHESCRGKDAAADDSADQDAAGGEPTDVSGKRRRLACGGLALQDLLLLLPGADEGDKPHECQGLVLIAVRRPTIQVQGLGDGAHRQN